MERKESVFNKPKHGNKIWVLALTLQHFKIMLNLYLSENLCVIIKFIYWKYCILDMYSFVL